MFYLTLETSLLASTLFYLSLISEKDCWNCWLYLEIFQCVTVLVWVLFSKQSLRWGTGFRRFVWEMILGSSSKAIWRMRRGGRNASEGFTTKLVITVGNWSLIPLGTLRKWVESLRISHWKAGRLGYLWLTGCSCLRVLNSPTLPNCLSSSWDAGMHETVPQFLAIRFLCCGAA